jgi:uncharacterized membrane protein
MAKKKADETTAAVDKPKSKAQSIRDALAAQPKAMPKEIADKLTAEGISVTANEVSQAKYQIKLAKKKRRQKAAPKAADAAPSAAAAPAGDLVSVAALQKAKKLVQELGGVKEARQALVALAQLLD